MREFSKVLSMFWTGTTGRRLRQAGNRAQLIALYLITNPLATMTGLYHLPLSILGDHCNWSRDETTAAIKQAVNAGFCEYDFDREEVWIPEMASIQVGENITSIYDRRRKPIMVEWQAYKKSIFYADFHARYREAFLLPDIDDKKAAKLASLGILTDPTVEQEQETEQQQEQGAAAAASTQITDLVAALVARGLSPEHAVLHVSETADPALVREILLYHDAAKAVKGKWRNPLGALRGMLRDPEKFGFVCGKNGWKAPSDVRPPSGADTDEQMARRRAERLENERLKAERAKGGTA